MYSYLPYSESVFPSNSKSPDSFTFRIKEDRGHWLELQLKSNNSFFLERENHLISHDGGWNTYSIMGGENEGFLSAFSRAITRKISGEKIVYTRLTCPPNRPKIEAVMHPKTEWNDLLAINLDELDKPLICKPGHIFGFTSSIKVNPHILRNPLTAAFKRHLIMYQKLSSDLNRDESHYGNWVFLRANGNILRNDLNPRDDTRILPNSTLLAMTDDMDIGLCLPHDDPLMNIANLWRRRTPLTAVKIKAKENTTVTFWHYRENPENPSNGFNNSNLDPSP